MTFKVSTAMATGKSTAIVAGALVLLSAMAQPNRPWFGLDMPEARAGRSLATRAVYLRPDIAPMSLRASRDDPPYRDIEAQHLSGFLDDIIDITEKNRPAGAHLWGRLAGSRAEAATADYVARRFEEFGLAKVSTEPYQGSARWSPLDWEVTLKGDASYGPGTENYRFSSAFPAVQEKAAALSVPAFEAELAYVGLGRALDLAGRDLRGKIAVMHSVLQPNPFVQTARGYTDDVAQAGVAGILIVLDAPGNQQYYLEGMGPPDIPAFGLGGDDGRFLEDAMTAARSSRPLRARLSLKTELSDPWQAKNVVGLIDGKSNEVIILLSHLDSYFQGANDNAGGLASMLALARHFSRPGAPKPARTLLFLGVSGAHDSSAGLKAFMASHPEVLARTVITLNIEHPSSIMSSFRGALRFGNQVATGDLVASNVDATKTVAVSNGNPLLISYFQEAIDRYGIVVDSAVSRRATGAAAALAAAGHAVIQVHEGGFWYHSSADVRDAVNPVGLERMTRFYAFILDRIDRTSTAKITQKPS